VEDFARATVVRVRSGTVDVVDHAKRKKVTVTAPHTYVAKPGRKGS
jgi:hypothetical protein